MTAYALAHLRRPTAVHPEVFEYMERIQSTLDPYSGRFLVHGAPVEVREGAWPGDLVMIGFPSMELARAWYDSPAYQEILPLRAQHLEGDLVLVEGVEPDHDSAAMAAAMRAALGAGTTADTPASDTPASDTSASADR
ncbi:Uncharacterized conserved protein, DUF1330 family [Streptoalloteichus tenebrarius]|uniref:Uncharacterized conserved protein, DUF1330 family n=1 Tax=Streptoalloteichus tenebrarius (strain ATCC 17920 / DSM 40477 / JCM 4838 / CBS 697.72 / NBRC 16177 / NCIMB 11028 / NRRL B-12390 / A12253. 1 / ISP 5477) TaxID=1933 RepID=A0ABT1I489_STRSD|nr:DUF1330 domain-containing protein [Streptoalloteichus tenebrarius]MCP2262541.1 Uncharacterized conserved protein, DUF1330 family [Streptoalloteichus tenebrarius]